MNLKRHFVVALAIFAIGAFSTMTLAKRGSGSRGADPEQRIERLAERLDLSETQQEEFAQVMEQRRNAIDPAEMRQARRALAQAVESSSFDEAAIRSAAAAVAEIEADRAVEQARVASELRAILTPEQFEKFKQMKERMAQRGGDRNGPRGRRPLGRGQGR